MQPPRLIVEERPEREEDSGAVDGCKETLCSGHSGEAAQMKS